MSETLIALLNLTKIQSSNKSNQMTNSRFMPKNAKQQTVEEKQQASSKKSQSKSPTILSKWNRPSIRNSTFLAQSEMIWAEKKIFRMNCDHLIWVWNLCTLSRITEFLKFNELLMKELHCCLVIATYGFTHIGCLMTLQPNLPRILQIGSKRSNEVYSLPVGIVIRLASYYQSSASTRKSCWQLGK